MRLFGGLIRPGARSGALDICPITSFLVRFFANGKGNMGKQGIVDLGVLFLYLAIKPFLLGGGVAAAANIGVALCKMRQFAFCVAGGTLASARSCCGCAVILW